MPSHALKNLFRGAMLALAVSLVAPALAAADAPDVTSGTGKVVQVDPSTGERLVRVTGTWEWFTHNSDCNTNRSGVGVAIDWGEGKGNFVTTLNGQTIDVGVASGFATAKNPTDNVAHPAEPGTDITDPLQYQLWRGGCGVFQGGHNHGTYGLNDTYPLQHWYPATGPIPQICAVTYDVHGQTAGQPNGSKEVTGGGSNRNGDNGVEKNASTPHGNECFTIHLNAHPSVTTNAGPDVTLGSALNDTATLSGGDSPTGTITFDLYGPADADCTGTAIAAAHEVVNVTHGNGNYSTTKSFKPTATGTYHWIANYSGDAKNDPTTNGCNDNGGGVDSENVVVGPGAPSLTTNAGAAVDNGTAIHDEATLSGGNNPKGTITFDLYGPNDANCTGTPVFSSAPVAVDHNGVYDSDEFTPSAAGTYRWIANYHSSDANNADTNNHCNETAESVLVRPVPAIDLDKTGPASELAGNDVLFTLTITNVGDNTLHSITWDDTQCFDSPVRISVNGDGSSSTFDPQDTWTYTCHVHTKAGDKNAHNEATVHALSPNNTPVSHTDTADTPLRNPDISIDKKENGSDGPITVTAGSTINYTMDVKNTGDQRFAAAAVKFTDAKCDSGTISGPNKHGDASPAFLNPNETWTWTCSHVTKTTDTGSYDNTAIASATDEHNDAVGPVDDTVTANLTPPPNPDIDVVKTGPASALAGDDVSFTLTVTNPGNQPLSNVVVKDTRCDASPPALQSKNTELGTPALLDPGETWTYTCSAHTTAGDTNLHNQVDVCGTTTAASNCTPPCTSAGATVCDGGHTDVPLRNPDIAIDKKETASAAAPSDGPITLTAGGTINYTLDVSNTGDQRFAQAAVLVTDAKCDAAPVLSSKNSELGTAGFLDPGETWTYTCSHATKSSDTGSYVNTGVANATDEHNDPVGPVQDSVTANLTPPGCQTNCSPPCTANCGPTPHPAIQIVKTGPATANAGDTIPYLLDVTNTGDQPFAEANLALTDQLCGTTPTLSSKNGDQSPAKLNPSETWTYTCSVPTVAGQTNVHNVGSVCGLPDAGSQVCAEDFADTVLANQGVEPLLPGVSRLRGPTGCIAARTHVLTVTGSRIKRVSFYLDGRYVGTRTKPNHGSTFTMTIRGAKLRRGSHRVVARVTYQPGTNPQTRTLTLAFARCARAVTPKFTG